MRKFNITLNGKQRYEVLVEEVEAEGTPEVSKTLRSESRTDFVPDGEDGASLRIYAPVSGTILRVAVTPGQNIRRGDVICTLEAMKVESIITAPSDGKILTVNVSKGIQVTGGALLATME